MADRYEFLTVLGEGANARVYRGRDKQADGDGAVAIKRFECECRRYSARGGAPAEMLCEVAAMRYLPPHRNVVAMLDVFHEETPAPHMLDVDGQPHMHRQYSIVYERMTLDLNAYLLRERGRFDPRLACSYAYQLLAALAHAHRCGVVHCDVKPANVLIDAAGALKLADFGSSHIARCPRRALPPPSACTLWYRAPEVLIGSSTLCDARLDVWAAACVIAEMAGGGHGVAALFPGEDECDQMMRVWRRLGPPPRDVLATATVALPRVLERLTAPAATTTFELAGTPPLALDLLRSMLRPDPRERPLAATCLRHAYFDEIRAEFEK
jgi:serine/threonine protein kinase